LDSCALKYIPDDTNFKFVICLEEVIDTVSGWDAAAQKCAKQFSINLD
jgi:hypothetical protein